MLSYFNYHAHRVYSHLAEDVHHVGLAVLPFILSREFMLAMLSVLLVLILFALQSIMVGETAAALALAPASRDEDAEDTP